MLDTHSDILYTCLGMNITPHQRTVDALLVETKGIPLADFIADGLEAHGDLAAYRAYELIASDLKEYTGGIVDVVGKTIERWHQAYKKAAA